MEGVLITLILIGFDILSGLIKAGYNKVLDSSKLRRGLFLKLSEIFAIIVSYVIDYALVFYKINIGLSLFVGVCIYISITEIISIIENICAVNPTLKNFFGKFLNKLKEGEENDKRN